MAGEPGLTTLSPEVRYRDDDVLVVEKPAGMLSHPVVAGEAGTLADWIRAEAGEAHLVNRLDRDTSGLVLAARTARGRRILDGQLARREVRRGYLAVVHGHPTEASGRVDAPIGRDPAAPSRRMVSPEGAAAVTRYRVVERLTDAALLELGLETGRTHQIRVHLEHLGYPVLGDRVYGQRGLELIGRQALHAHRISFRHLRLGEAVVVESPLPSDVETLLARLRAASCTR